jgi:hypothetical protein
MATFYWEYFGGAGPAWTDMSTNTIVFAGSNTDLTVPVTVGTWQDGTHMGNDDPGTDQCGAQHMRNIKYVTSGQFDQGFGTYFLSMGQIAASGCTVRVRFTDASPVAITSARLYAFDGSTVTTRATDVEVFGWERQPSGIMTWSNVNDYSAAQGGDNAGQRLDLLNQAASTEHHYYIVLSARPESVGAKTSFDFGVALTYS